MLDFFILTFFAFLNFLLVEYWTWYPFTSFIFFHLSIKDFLPFLSDLIVGFLGLEALLRVEVEDEELPFGVTELTTVFVGSWAGAGVKFEIVTLLLSSVSYTHLTLPTKLEV